MQGVCAQLVSVSTPSVTPLLLSVRSLCLGCINGGFLCSYLVPPVSLNCFNKLCTAFSAQMSTTLSLRLLHCYSKPGEAAVIKTISSICSTWGIISSHLYVSAGTVGPGVIRPFSLSVQREGYSKYCCMDFSVEWPHCLKWTNQTLLSPSVLLVEYVNNQELQTDLRSITDRAATTILWTELFRGHTYTHVMHRV